jgi:hypothetical protein
VGTEAGLVAGTVARGPMLDRGLTSLAVVEGRIVAELTDEARASGFVPPVVSVDLVVELVSGLVVVVLGLAALARGAVTGLVVLAAVEIAVVLEDSLDAAGRAGGTGGLVLVLNGLAVVEIPTAAGADLGLEP